jgi:hypothetical protein
MPEVSWQVSFEEIAIHLLEARFWTAFVFKLAVNMRPLFERCESSDVII